MTTEIRNLRDASERAWEMAVDTCYVGCTDEIDEARQAECQHAADAADEAWGRALDALDGRRIEDARRISSEWGDDDHECRALEILRSTTWTLRIDDDGGEIAIDAASLDEARATWIEWAREGEYGDVADGLPREFIVRGTVTSPLGEVHDVSVRLTRS
ncbi:MAG: hypothetical protein RIS45_792 [Planctomycetota bacterium]